MTAPLLRWTRRALDALLLGATGAVTLIGGLTLLAAALGGTTLIIAGGSMEPAIPRGAYTLAVPTAFGDLRLGDVVTVREGTKAPVTHRILRFALLPSTDGLIRHAELKGDANAAPDPVLVPETAILGRVELSLPVVGYLAAILASPLGLAGFLACCATVICLVGILEEVEEGRIPAGVRIRAAVGEALSDIVGPLDRPAGRARSGSPVRPPDWPVIGPAMYERGPTPRRAAASPCAAPRSTGDAGARAA